MRDAELDVLREYERSLHVPTERPRPQFLLCPVGLVGAGKTTVVKPIAERLGLLRISGDEIRKILKKRGMGYEATIEIGQALIERYLKAGLSVAIDSDCASAHTREFVVRAEKELSVKPIWIHIAPPESFIIDKLKNFRHTWLFKDGDEAIANYFRRKPLHEKLDMPFTFTFDTSRSDLPDQIEKGVAAISDALALKSA